MRKILLNIFCAFIPSKRLRKKIRRLCPRRTRYSSENTVHIPKNLKNIDIVGNPARVVKENIHWKSDRPDMYDNAKNGRNLWERK